MKTRVAYVHALRRSFTAPLEFYCGECSDAALSSFTEPVIYEKPLSALCHAELSRVRGVERREWIITVFDERLMIPARCARTQPHWPRKRSRLIAVADC